MYFLLYVDHKGIPGALTRLSEDLQESLEQAKKILVNDGMTSQDIQAIIDDYSEDDVCEFPSKNGTYWLILED